MRTHDKHQMAQLANNRLLQLDFHDFLKKSVYMEDVELSEDLGIVLDEIRLLKAKLGTGRR